jgi:raffinose/stachyose/melibiose transport system permease protein
LAYTFLLPALGLVLFFSYYPAGMAFYYSLTNFSLRSVTEFVGLRNYADVLMEDRYFRTGVVNMVIIVVTSVLKTVSVPLLAAELVFWLRNAPHQYVYRTLFVLPAVVPDLVFTLMWRQVYDPYTGLLNRLLGSVGLSEWQRAWLGDEGTALWAVIGVGFPFIGAFAFLIFLGGLLSINRDYFDAARVDGAGRWARFRHIDVPLLLPQFRILLFFAITGTVQGFAAIFVLTRGGPGTATYVPALQMYRRIGEGDFGYASAVGVVLFVVILALTFVVLRFRRQDALELS